MKRDRDGSPNRSTPSGGIRLTPPVVGHMGSRFGGAAAILALIALVLVAFEPVRENGFVSLDDKKTFLENPSFRGLGLPQLEWAWTSRDLGVYEPLGRMLLELEYQAWGLNPRGYHLASLALFVMVAIGLYVLTLAAVARSRNGSWHDDPGCVRLCALLAVALYAVHPLRVQLVAWASCQTYVTCGLFSVLTVLAYLRAHDEAGRIRGGWLIGSGLLYVAALLSKAPAITLPAVLLILDVYPLRRLGPGRWFGPQARRAYVEKVPFVVLSAIFMALAVWARGRAMAPVAGHGLEARVARAFYNVVFYLAQTVFPARISVNYPVPLRMTLSEPRFLLSALAVAAATLVLVLLRRRFPGALAAWVAYLVMLAPSSGLFRTGGTYIAADRYGFLPMMALTVLLASALCEILGSRRVPRWVAGSVLIAGVIAVVVLVARTRDECRHWHDSRSLWAHAVAVSTEPNPFANHGLALALLHDPGELRQAERLLNEALRAAPEHPTLHSTMTIVLARQGRTAEALGHAREAVRLGPDEASAWVNLGNVLAMRGDPVGAMAAFDRALARDAGNADAHGNLGMMLAVQGRTAEAEAHLAEALRLNPGATATRRTLEDLRRRALARP